MGSSMKFLIKFSLSFLVLVISNSVVAQNYPNKPIKLLVPFGAGGITDVVARAFAEPLSAELGQQVIVENKPGAGGNIAAELLKTSASDGYTLMLTTIGVVAVNPHTYATIKFDSLKDFSYISTVAETPHVIAINPSVPAKNLSELIKLAKDKPESISFGTAGYGSSPYQGMEILQTSTGVKFLHVPFKSGAESVTNVIGGQVLMTFEAIPVVMPQAQAGKLRVLGIASAKRNSAAADLLTTAELGFPGVVSGSVSGLIGPAGLPAEVIARLNKAARAALSDPKLRAKLQAQGTSAEGSTSAQFFDLVKSEHSKWGKLMSNIPKQ
jgi:tripartite-type tricarboxylate transporter receptor subunit TctC